MSPTSHLILAMTGGLVAGLTLAALPLWRLRRALRTARFQAGHDDTTGLPNRRTFLTALQAALAAGRPFGVILLDLDGFKAVNDTYGHETGNDLLTAVAHRLNAVATPAVLAARLSGDEFAVLALGGPDEVHTAAQAAADAVGAEPVVLDGGTTVAVHASVGYTTSRLGITARALLREADEAVYRAKTHPSGLRRHPTTPDAHSVAGTAGQPHAAPRRSRDRRH
ncbi:GGDEF domain-containing protein [Dactylosporangium sp. NBC_01737]|uniref:GGDEF domain-containing protein n=1 Tax=Dactylosporangium sp. NBC_01737 TaxID=2975959 RepID=UPI002E104BA8|nr:GGDEF domain-containing protein [Dactylosporangium sp. NBC_01737]